MRKGRKFLKWSLVLISIVLSIPMYAGATTDDWVIQEMKEFHAEQPYAVELGRPVKVLPGTVYYASADYGGSGGQGVIGNDYTQGNLYVLGYALLDDEQRISDRIARRRDQIIELEEPICFAYSDDEVKSIMVGLYTDEYANGAIGWVPANTTNIPGSEYFEQLLGVTPEDDEQNIDEDLKPDVEDVEPDLEPDLETPVPVDNELDEPEPENEPDNDIDDYSIWQFLGDLIWAIIKALGCLILLLFLAYLMIILVVLTIAALANLMVALSDTMFGAGSVICWTVVIGLCIVLSLFEEIVPEVRFLTARIYDNHKKRVKKKESEDELRRKFKDREFAVRDYCCQPEEYQTFREFDPKVTSKDAKDVITDDSSMVIKQTECCRVQACCGSSDLDNLGDAPVEGGSGASKMNKSQDACVVIFTAYEAQYPNDWVAAWIIADED